MKSLFSEDDIQAALDNLAPKIVADLGADFMVVPILTGGFIFAADLTRALFKAGGDPEIDFLQLSSYGAAKESSGEVKLVKDLSTPVEGQTILLVDDVLDSGRSLFFAQKLLDERGAGRVVVCVAVDKNVERAHDVSADYALFKTDTNPFLVGYGMDDAGLKRAMPYIGKVD